MDLSEVCFVGESLSVSWWLRVSFAVRSLSALRIPRLVDLTIWQQRAGPRRSARGSGAPALSASDLAAAVLAVLRGRLLACLLACLPVSQLSCETSFWAQPRNSQPRLATIGPFFLLLVTDPTNNLFKIDWKMRKYHTDITDNFSHLLRTLDKVYNVPII